MDLDSTEEAALRLDGSKEKNGGGDGNGGINTVLNAGKDRHDDTDKEDGNLQRRSSPKFVDRVGGCDQVTDCMDDDGREGRRGNVEEDGRQSINGKKGRSPR